MKRFEAFCLATITMTIIVYILWVARSFFMPLVCAGAIAYLIITVAEAVRKVTLRGHALPYWAALVVTIVGFVFVTNVVARMIGDNIVSLLNAMPAYQERLVQKTSIISASVGEWFDLDYSQLFEKIDLVWVTRVVFRTLTDLAGSAGLITIYLIFFLMEYSFLGAKIAALFPVAKHREMTQALIKKVVAKVNTYVRIKTVLSLLTAFCSYLVLAGVGVDFAQFSAFLIFLLNFIPTVGSIIATIFPCMLAFVQFETLAPLVAVAVLLVSIQMVIGNIIEPRVMGSSFNLSGLVIILSLTIWGYIWGIIGMFLSVPIMVIISIILANFPQTRWLAVILSQDGKVD